MPEPIEVPPSKAGYVFDDQSTDFVKWIVSDDATKTSGKPPEKRFMYARIQGGKTDDLIDYELAFQTYGNDLAVVRAAFLCGLRDNDWVARMQWRLFTASSEDPAVALPMTRLSKNEVETARIFATYLERVAAGAIVGKRKEGCKMLAASPFLLRWDSYARGEVDTLR